ncbi:hypothetical protein RFI_19216, partial [Reticulomyxa filosa]
RCKQNKYHYDNNNNNNNNNRKVSLSQVKLQISPNENLALNTFDPTRGEDILENKHEGIGKCPFARLNDMSRQPKMAKKKQHLQSKVQQASANNSNNPNPNPNPNNPNPLDRMQDNSKMLKQGQFELWHPIVSQPCSLELDCNSVESISANPKCEEKGNEYGDMKTKEGDEDDQCRSIAKTQLSKKKHKRWEQEAKSLVQTPHSNSCATPSDRPYTAPSQHVHGQFDIATEPQSVTMKATTVVSIIHGSKDTANTNTNTNINTNTNTKSNANINTNTNTNTNTNPSANINTAKLTPDMVEFWNKAMSMFAVESMGSSCYKIKHSKFRI